MKQLHSLYKRHKKIFLAAVFIAAFTAVIISIFPVKQAFEYNPDEGRYLEVSSLYLKGFSLYNQIWFDQPPLFPLLLSFWLKLFGISLYHARILVIIFSGLLIWAFYQTIKIDWGRFTALSASVFLILSSSYLRLSASVMLNLPALAFAMVSIYFLSLYRQLQKKNLLLLSGIAMGLSLQIKLITLFLIPIIIAQIIYKKFSPLKNTRIPPGLSDIFIWVAGLLAAYAPIALMFFHANPGLFTQQLIIPHIKSLDFSQDNLAILRKFILADYDFLLLALLGIFIIIKQKKYLGLLPAAWLIFAFAILSKHQPLWHHYYLLISIPLSWLAAIALNALFPAYKTDKGYPQKKFFSLLAAGLLLITIARLPLKLNRTLQSLTEKNTTEQENLILKSMAKYKDKTEWIFTDRPIFAIYADIPVPPELALVTYKRSFSDQLTSNFLKKALEQYNPEQLLLNKLEFFSPETLFFIETRYTKIYADLIPKRIGEFHYKEFSLIERFLIKSLVKNYSTPFNVSKEYAPEKTSFTNITLYLRNDLTK